MAKNLVIVESPAKAKTIKKFLGSSYEVIASNGHVRDLPKSKMGIDVDDNFEPKYITIRGKGDLLATLRKEVKKADKVYLATDPDREGEAISWHLSKALNLENKKYKRITFNEITKSAVKGSLKEARDIDMDLVDAQQARRVLDRLVGYEISPVLWAKIKRGLSAGRVQSVALRMICDREEEINNFIPEEYWTLEAEVRAAGGKTAFTAKLQKTPEGKAEIHSEEQMKKILTGLTGVALSVKEMKKASRIKNAPLPFTTSTLQQEAAKKLNFATGKTMRIAQQLYEGVEIKGKGSIGLITYLRTDSVRISDEANTAALDYIEQHYGKQYVGAKEAKSGTGKKIQDAHEAIRPTDITLSPVKLKEQLSRDQFRLYQLIYNRFLASRMESAKYESETLKLEAKGYEFGAVSTRLVFDGFMAVYAIEDENDELKNKFKQIDKDTPVVVDRFIDKQHFTQPPAHYTEGSLVKRLEELGIGRPSTYAPTISTILGRRYVVKENRNLYVTELGEAVNQIMLKAFPVIVDTEFTANLESLLDKIEEGTVDWKTVVANFYPDLDEAVTAANKELEQIKIEDEVTEEICDECGRNLVVKYGPHGKFLACPGFPDCRFTKPYFEKIGVECPECGKDIVLKKTKKGRKYYGCINNPDCGFMSWQRPSETKCEKCGNIMVIKGNKLVCHNEECGYVLDKPKDKA
ncbi:MAG: type I DNA topoisomerase [Bacteroidales bacterium]|nr:type I DNA topoisomerase [Clostridium sp.]MCM1202715.1 type I DNA topoisomerase [Bacteroidales bacterium]